MWAAGRPRNSKDEKNYTLTSKTVMGQVLTVTSQAPLSLSRNTVIREAWPATLLEPLRNRLHFFKKIAFNN